ncbi:hypothetical protein WR25_03859 [Diploscapter pachys]|uniref:Uncharacterized protein n=1 Tax=Diploscapter pachys TaxID=2018661 RepID=A0A2A2JMS7_9BILA|nr:hypothetical protein WR25_03859 [Diploscapter pachys]
MSSARYLIAFTIIVICSDAVFGRARVKRQGFFMRMMQEKMNGGKGGFAPGMGMAFQEWRNSPMGMKFRECMWQGVDPSIKQRWEERRRMFQSLSPQAKKELFEKFRSMREKGGGMRWGRGRFGGGGGENSPFRQRIREKFQKCWAQVQG